MDNLIMLSVINVFNSGSSQIETDLSFSELEKARYELMERGYKCQIVKELGKLQFIVESK